MLRNLRRRFLSTLVLLAVWGCAEGLPPATPPPPPPKAAVTPPAGPEPPLPPLAEVPFPDWGDVDPEEFIVLPAPAAPPVLRWDFSPGRRSAYDFSQTLNQVIVAVQSGVSTENRSRDRNRGTFEFVAGRDRQAKVFIRIETQEAVRNGVAASREELDKATASKFECTLAEDGKVEVKKLAGQADAQFFFESLLALGEGEKTIKDGRAQTKVAGYRKVGRHDCARLETEFDLAPQTASGRSVLRGRTVAYFDLAGRRFVRTSTSVTTSSRMKALNPNVGWIVNSLDAKTSFRLKLLESP